MNLHEFQAKELLARFGVAIPEGRLASSAEEARNVARRLGFSRFAVKSQVRMSDRASNGGVHLVDSPEAAGDAAEGLIGRPLQSLTGAPLGEVVRHVLVEELIEAQRLLYVATAIDHARGWLVLLASASGGSGIETLAAGSRGDVLRRDLSMARSDDAALFRELAGEVLGGGPAAGELAAVLAMLAKATRALDATMIEINPLALTPDGRLVALDAKVAIDDNALFRQRELARLRDVETEESGDPAVLAADRHQINYLKLDGDIGVVVNGAGLALATLDTLADAGGRAANFMDIRTTATSQDIAFGFRLIAANPGTRVVLVNVHGGGMQRCDTIAEGMAIAMRGSNRPVPLVVRFAGNNAEMAAVRLDAAGITYEAASDMKDAAERAVRLSRREAA